MKRSIEEQLEAIFEEYAESLEAAKDVAAETTAKETVQELKSASPVGTGPRAGKYARGWRSKETDDGYVVYNATDWQLTHLLNNGHDLYLHGNHIGYQEGDNHIGKVEQKMIEEYENAISRGLS